MFVNFPIVFTRYGYFQNLFSKTLLWILYSTVHCQRYDFAYRHSQNTPPRGDLGLADKPVAIRYACDIRRGNTRSGDRLITA